MAGNSMAGALVAPDRAPLSAAAPAKAPPVAQQQAHPPASAASSAPPPLMRLPIKLAALAVRGRLAPWELAQLALASRHCHAVACASITSMILRDARFAGGGSGTSCSGSGGGSGSGSGGGAREPSSNSGGGSWACAPAAAAAPPGDAPPFPACAAVSLRPRTVAMLTKMVAGLLLPGGQLKGRLPAIDEIAIEIHDVFVAQCDLSLHITSVALHAGGVRRLRVDQPGLFTVREAAAVARMAALESLAIVCTQGLEPNALATLASGVSPAGGSAQPACPAVPGAPAGLRGRLKHLHIELVSDDSTPGCSALDGAPTPTGSAAPRPGSATGGAGAGAGAAGAAGAAAQWVGAPLSPATPGGRQSGAPPALSAADEMALAGFAPCLESLALIGLKPQLRACAAKPWDVLLSDAADACARAAAAPGGATAGAGPPRGAALRRLALRGCGEVGLAALAAAADVSTLEQVDLSGSRVPGTDAARLARVSGLAGLGVAPLPAPHALLAALAAGCPALRRVSAGGLRAAADGEADAGGGGDGGAPAAPAALPAVSELQLLGCWQHGPQALSGAGLHLAPALFPGLSSLEVTGAWNMDAAAVAAVCDLLPRCRRLRRVHLEGCASRPLHAPLLLPLLAAAPGVRCLELLCVKGMDDGWMGEVVARATKAGTRCVFREVAHLALGAPPPPPPGAAAPPPPPLLALPPTVSKAAAAAAAAAGKSLAPPGSAAAATFGGAAPGQLSDKGLVRLFGCMRLQRLALHHLPGVTLAGIKALTRGVPGLERVACAACPALSATTPGAAAAAGAMGARVVAIDVTD